MRAIRVHGVDLVLEDGVPEPEPGPGEALVAVEAGALARLDLQIARGEFPARPPAPYIPGLDGAGRVLGGDGAAAGQRVWFRGAGLGVVRNGALAERVAVPSDILRPLPEDVDAPLAATFFVPCMSARAALHEIGLLRPGERVAVRGAGGAVGRVAVQMALQAGAGEVVALLLHDVPVPGGVRAIVAPSAEELRALEGLDVDLLVDTVGGPGLPASLGLMRPRGRIVLVGYVGGTQLELDATELLVRDVSLLPLNGLTRAAEVEDHAGAWLRELTDGTLELPVVVFPPDRLDDAIGAVTASPSRGRVAIGFDS
jgi:NADPH2:quinone reductase